MGDSYLTVYMGFAAGAVIVLALVMSAVAWRIPKRRVRVGLGLGLTVLGLLGGGALVRRICVGGRPQCGRLDSRNPNPVRHPSGRRHRHMKRQTMMLGTLTAWPFVFGTLGLLAEVFGLIPKGRATHRPLRPCRSLPISGKRAPRAANSFPGGRWARLPNAI